MQYTGCDQVKEDEMGWVCSMHGLYTKFAYKILVGTPEGKIPLGRISRKSEDYIRLDLKEIMWEGVDRMHLVQDRDQWRAVVNTVMNLRFT
jgi:hypothetical protein